MTCLGPEIPPELSQAWGKLCLLEVPLTAAVPTSTPHSQLQLGESWVEEEDGALPHTPPFPATAVGMEGTP